MLRFLYFAVLVVLAVGYYEFFGPGPTPSEFPEDLEWWRPYGFARSWGSLRGLAEGGFPGALVPISLFTLPPILLVIVGFRLFKGAVLRTFFSIFALTTALFVYYGYMADRVWRLFGWRFSAVVVSFAAIVVTMLFAPSLLRSILRRSLGATAVVLALVFAGIFLLSTEITGTNPYLLLDISPWPVLTLFGFLLFGSWLAAMHGAAGIGSWLAGRLGGAGGMALGGLAAAAVGGAMALVIFGEPTAGRIATLAVMGAVYAIVCVYTAPEDRAGAGRAGLVRLAAGVFLFAAIHLSNQAAIAYQTTARNETATQVLVALEDYKEKHGTYPKRLHYLVPEFLDEVPRPRMGLILNEDDEFIYSYFGASYALEFNSVQWVQCGYSPPFEYAEFDTDEEQEGGDEEAGMEGEEDDDSSDAVDRPETFEDRALRAMLADHGLDGSWNCANAPPKLW